MRSSSSASTGAADVTGPSPRTYARMVWDTQRGRGVLFGGKAAAGATCPSSTATGVCGDTWVHDGAGWTLLAASGPPARTDHAMGYDPIRDRVVLYGGRGNQLGAPASTWELDGSRWVEIARPMDAELEPRAAAAMVFDAARGKIVLHGGVVPADGPYGSYRSYGYGRDTWAWDGARWARVASGGPTDRERFGMAFDGSRGRVVLYGGHADFGCDGQRREPYCASTWALEGDRWTRLETRAAPRQGHAMVHDEARRTIISSGGYRSPSRLCPAGECQETWAFAGDRWVQVGPIGPRAIAAARGWCSIRACCCSSRSSRSLPSRWGCSRRCRRRSRRGS